MCPVDEIVLPEVKEDDFADVPKAGIDLASPATHEKIVTANEYKKGLQGYLASTSYADAQIGRVLAALEASPYRDNTLVVLWSDHGFHLGEKSHWAKSTLWEEATHANLMFRVPGVTKPRQLCNRFVSLLDIYPTLIELCGLPAASHHDGNSLVPLLRNPTLRWDKLAITGFLDMWKLDVHLSVRTENYRYIRYGQGGEEFYHCRMDPHEWTNEIGNPKFQADLKRHIAMLPEPADPIQYKERNGKKK